MSAISVAGSRQASGQETAERWLRRLEAGDPDLGQGLLIVAAHPDDEVIGVGAQLARLKGVRLLHVTDGAPRNMLDAAAAGFDSWQAYARARRRELLAALALADIEESWADALGVPDQGASHQLVGVAEALAMRLGEVRPEIVMTHPYEGGHPDHDATAFAVHAACSLAGRRGGREPGIVEMTCYHAAPGGRAMSKFLPDPSVAITTLALGETERVFKQRLVDCFSTQTRVLADFPIDVERFRPAPVYDFARPPHEGQLYYENFDWGIHGARWRELAAEALAALSSSGEP